MKPKKYYSPKRQTKLGDVKWVFSEERSPLIDSISPLQGDQHIIDAVRSNSGGSWIKLKQPKFSRPPTPPELQGIGYKS